MTPDTHKKWRRFQFAAAVMFYGITRALSAPAPDDPAANPKVRNPMRAWQEQTDILRDIPYAAVGDHTLRLDLYRPKKADGPLPLIIWIHGGGWRQGDKAGCKGKLFTRSGFAVAGINYRLTDLAPFPAQIHDCKGAIRFLRANAGGFGIDPNSIGVWGSSAGGHLAALLGTSGGVEQLEGDVGGNLGCSSRVQAVCDWYGPADFPKFADPDTLDPTIHPLLEALFGGPVYEKKELAKAASPVTHISKDDPPFLIMHGDQDMIVHIGQSQLLFKELKKKKVPVELLVIEGAGHSFPDPAQLEQVLQFFQKHLKK